MKKNIIVSTVLIAFIYSCSSASYIDPYGRDKKIPYIVEGLLDHQNELIQSKDENESVKNEVVEVTRVDVIPTIPEINKAKETKKENDIPKFYGALSEKEKKIYDKIYGIEKVKLEKEVTPIKKEKIEKNIKVIDPEKIEIITAEVKPEKQNVVVEKEKIKPKEKEVAVLDSPKQEAIVKKEEEKPIITSGETVVSEKEQKVVQTENKEEIKEIKPEIVQVVEEKAPIIEKKEIERPKINYSEIKLSSKDRKILNLIKSYYKILESENIMELKTKELVYEIRQKQDKGISTTAVLKEIHEEIKSTNTRAYVLAVSRVMKNRGLK